MADMQPSKSSWNDVVRTMLEKYVEAQIPFYGSLVTYAGRIFIPTTLESQTKAWQEDLASRVSNLGSTAKQLSGAVSLSELALDIGLYISRESQDGIVEQYEVEKIIAQFSRHTESEIYEACGELEHAEVCYLRELINSAGYLILNIEFFFVFDPYVHSWHPALDVAELARRIVDITATEQVAVSPNLATELGWGARRFNPPLQMIVKYISEGRVSQGYTPPWAHRYLCTTPGERASLRKLAQSMDGQ